MFKWEKVLVYIEIWRKKMKSKVIFKIVSIFMAMLMFSFCFEGCKGDETPSSSNTETSSALSNEQTDSKTEEGSSLEESSSSKKEESSSSSKVTTSTNASSEAESKKTVFDLVDFVVEVPAGREPVILQLTDTQIIDSSQERSENRLGDSQDALWGPDTLEKNLFQYIKETINATKPDLILVTGDLVYGEFDDKGTSMQALIKHMESYKIPWAPIYGNHEGETELGIDWYSKQLEDAKYCLFKQKQLHKGAEIGGCGNYTVGIKQGGKLTRVFFMMDSNGYTRRSMKTVSNIYTTSAIGLHSAQQEWSSSKMLEILSLSKNTKFSLAYHIPNLAAQEAFSKYEKGTDISAAENKGAEDFGFKVGEMSEIWDRNNSYYNNVKICGVDSILMGHYHSIGATVKSDGVYFIFGLKTGTYDSHIKRLPNGELVTTGAGTSLVGGTVMTLKTDGTISKLYNYICGEK